MAKLAWLMFTLVILNSTVKINADFQLITALAKLIETVEQMNSSISKINDRLEKLESTIPIKTEPIVPDTEPKHGLIDNMIKMLESEKVFIRKSVSAHEKKFQAFESQMKRHLSTIYSAIDSNKDISEKQIQLINVTFDKKSDTFQKELILINVNIDEKADALEQQMVLVNATIDSHNEMVEKRIQLINVTIDKKSDTLVNELRLINKNIDKGAEALEQQVVLVNATIDSNKETLETQIQLINATIDKKFDTLEKELRLISTTLERQYKTQRCSYSHGSLQLYDGDTKLNIAEHDQTVEVKCKSGDNYELKNTETDQYINSFNTKCLFGHLEKDLSMLKCFPKRCSYSHGSLQLYSGNKQLNIAEHDSTVEVKCKNGDNYELKNTETDQYTNSFNTKCLFGHLDKDLSMLKCLPKRCSYSHGSFQLYSGNKQLNIAEHDSTVGVKCKNSDKYELKNTETDKYIDGFNTKCLFGHLDKDLSMLKCIPNYPENCHTFGEALYRSPRYRGIYRIGMLTLHECKKLCVTSRSLKCKSVFYMPSRRDRGAGICYHYEHSPDDDRYFRDNYRSETHTAYVSYERIC